MPRSRCVLATLMKTLTHLCSICFTLPLLTAAHAALDIPSDGSDGALNITSNTVIDLSQAVTGVWSNNNSANAGKGIYDASKWAVVFKYSAVNIASNATVTFKNHGSRAPVVWLVSRDVILNGELSLDGQNATLDTVNLPEPGPGGFRGGAANQQDLGFGGGFGPGGYYDFYGAYQFPVDRAYGNPQIIPLIGGSGGSGSTHCGNVPGANGPGGGGAILIASSNNIIVNGYCHANGLRGPYCGYVFASGGAIRLVADQILGAGRIEAVGIDGYAGRTRLEANAASPSLDVNPPTVAVLPTPLVIWPAASAPTVRVVSVDAHAAPLDPRANIGASGDDLTISTTSANNIVLQTSNFPTNGTVNVYIKPKHSPQSILPASLVSGNSALATWQLQTVLPLSLTVIQARAVMQ